MATMASGFTNICTEYGCCYTDDNSDNTYEFLGTDTVTNNIILCLASGGHLAWIETQAENDCLVDYITDQFEHTTSTKYAIGLQDGDVKGVWKWYETTSAGTGTTATFQRWAPGSPDGGGLNSCAGMYVGGTGRHAKK